MLGGGSCAIGCGAGDWTCRHACAKYSDHAYYNAGCAGADAYNNDANEGGRTARPICTILADIVSAGGRDEGARCGAYCTYARDYAYYACYAGTWISAYLYRDGTRDATARHYVCPDNCY